MSVALSDVLDITRTYLNDEAAQNWSNAALIPKVQQAHRELQIKLKKSAAPVMKGNYSELLGIGVTAFISQPTDIIAPIQLWEAAQASTPSYVPMTEVDDLPSQVQGSTLGVWTWDQEVVKFLGSTTTRQVKMQYWRKIPIPAVLTDLIGFIDGELYLGPRAAAIAELSVGGTDQAALLTTIAEGSLNDIILSNRGRAPQVQGGSLRP